MYYPREEKLVSLDVLKLYWGEDIVWQNPEDLDPDRWLDEGELTELQVGAREQPEDQGRHELHPEPALDIPMITNSEIIAERGVHERIQAEIQHKNKEVEVAEEEMLEISPKWNVVPDLIMEDNKELMITETDNKQNREMK